MAGKFDSPDRMFHSLEHSYASILTNHADVKGTNEKDTFLFFIFFISKPKIPSSSDMNHYFFLLFHKSVQLIKYPKNLFPNSLTLAMLVSIS